MIFGCNCDPVRKSAAALEEIAVIVESDGSGDVQGVKAGLS